LLRLRKHNIAAALNRESALVFGMNPIMEGTPRVRPIPISGLDCTREEVPILSDIRDVGRRLCLATKHVCSHLLNTIGQIRDRRGKQTLDGLEGPVAETGHKRPG